MITEEEKEEIINMAVEKALLMLPEVVSALFQEKIAMSKLTKDFYSNNKEFYEHKDIVASVIQEIEGKNPGKQYTDIIKDAAPIIKRRIETIGKLDMNKPEKPTDFKFSDHGTL